MTRTIDVARCERGAPVALQVHAPLDGAGYPLIVFQHGFVAENRAYAGLLRHVASHGFVVVAPQMYPPGFDALAGNPTASQEADLARAAIDWLNSEIATIAGVATRSDRLGLAGHSRGGKVVWLMLKDDPDLARAAAGVDPVDGRGGPLGAQPRALDDPAPFGGPTLILGTGRGGDCAPSGENHEQFFEAALPMAFHVVAPDQGHGDMLDADSVSATLLEAVCYTGEQRDEMRRLCAGALVLLFRAALQDQPAALDDLRDTAPYPLPVEFTEK